MHEAPGASPAAPPREAATVMLVRDAPGLEVFMLRRNADSVWVPDVELFPGGAIDAEDRSPELAGRADVTDEWASARLGLRRGGLGFWIGAVRETFEEAGVLLAEDATGMPVDARDEHLAGLRDALNDGSASFTDLVVPHDLRLRTRALHVFSHWITPPGAPRRYDTWFFVAAAPAGHEYAPDDRETVAAQWIRPADALAAADEGRIQLIFPTRRNLDALSRFETAEELLGWLDDVDQRAPALVRESGAGERVPLPGDPDPGGIDAPREAGSAA